MSGTAASADNAFRFSTKWQDDQSDLYYYGYRFYNADTGRWPNKDPMAEQGGNNLYGFVGNNPISQVDLNGEILLDTALDLLVLGADVSAGMGASTISLDVAALAISFQPTPLPVGANPRGATIIYRMIKGERKAYELVDHALLSAVADEPNFKGIVINDLASRPQKATIGLEYRGRRPNEVGRDYDRHFKSFASTVSKAKETSLKGASQFAPGVGDEQVRQMINEALKKQKAEFSQTFLNQLNGYVYDAGLPYGSPGSMRLSDIGYSNGQCTSRIRLSVGKDGSVHAFPTLEMPTRGGSVVTAGPED
jgi:RHS repeat-associated protein